MNKPLQSLLILCLSVMLLACGKNADHQNKSNVYDYRDERHQDFYSRYMRNAKQGSLTIDSQAIRAKLKATNVPDHVLGQLNVYRTDPNDKINSPLNQLKNRAEILAFYNRDGDKFGSCDVKDQEEHFFCIVNKKIPNEPYYFYLPNESNNLKYIDHPISFTCTKLQGRKNCRLFHTLNYPNNAHLSIFFTDSQNFFYLMPYIEQHFYETTGEHVWENAPPSHASAAQ